MQGVSELKRKHFITLLISLLIITLAYFAVGNYFYNFALNAKGDKDFLVDNPHLAVNPAVDVVREAEERSKDIVFIEQHTAAGLDIVSKDKLKLKLNANLFENGDTNEKWAIVVHGYTSKANDMTRWVRNFYEQGYHVLAPDLRGHGASEGEYIGMGWHDRLDLLQWIDVVTAMNPDAEIVLFGVSMGAATVMMASGEELPSNVKVIVEDCGYSTVGDVFVYQLDDLFGLPSFPVMNAANMVTKVRAGYDLFEASAVAQVAKSITPTLFIHGDSDTFVPYEMLDLVYDVATVEKDKVVIEQASHGDAVKVDPDLYWATIWRFVGQYIE